MGIEYKTEFFDREYTFREAYGRVWKYARKYKFRIVVGIVCGMLTAGTLLPIFSVVQPALEKVSQNERLQTLREEFADRDQGSGIGDQPADAAIKQSSNQIIKQSAFERELAHKSKLPSWFPKAEKFAAKFGIRLQDENGEPLPVYSIASGLDYPSVGPEHAMLHKMDRVKYVTIGDEEAIEALFLLSRNEGIIPAIESAHAMAYAFKKAK